MRWSVVVPVKRLTHAKTRLEPPGDTSRQELALAMALDTVRAALDCPEVALVLAVSDDEVAVPRLRILGATVVPDAPDAGLNPALAYGAAEARARQPDCGIAMLSSDLPALRPGDLAAALREAAGHDVAVVADATGTGTVLLTARSGVQADPAFGPGSLAAHRQAGAVELVLPEGAGLRRDVDTAADLAEARALGLGEHTAMLLGWLPARR